MDLNENINNDLEPVTGHSDEAVAKAMLHQLSHDIPNQVERRVPSAAAFAQGVKILGPELGECAGSGARDEWLSRMADIEDSQIGPVRRLITNLIGEPHPVLRQSIDWIKQYGDSKSFAIQSLLADLQMAVGEEEEAKETYAAALRMHRETRPEVLLTE